jgi:hypothetical protein
MNAACRTVIAGIVLAGTFPAVGAAVAAPNKPDNRAAPSSALADAATAKSVLDVHSASENLLDPDAWRPWQKGFQRRGDLFVCDNGDQRGQQRGASQTVVLNQTRPEPIVAVAWSKAEAVTGSPDSDYSLYLDLVFTDGTPLWGRIAQFPTGSHDWERRRVIVLPEKPVRSVAFHMLLRNHGGKAWFRDPELRMVKTPAGACRFDGVPVVRRGDVAEGFQVRDVVAGSDFVRIDREALGLKLAWKQEEKDGATLVDATLSDTTGKDRAITLVYAIPIPGGTLRWLHDPRRTSDVEPGREYINAGHFRVGANGRLSRYPFAAVADEERGVALGIDMARPAFFRIGYNAGSRELFLAYDIALTPEKPHARVRFCRFGFDPAWGFRAALAKYYELFPRHFACRTPEQGLWMPFAKISEVEGWEDFGFHFKEGNNETAWDDEHGIITFRYTEPMTWWMRMPTDMPRTLDAALAEAERRAEKGDASAKALITSGYHDEAGRFPARLLDTPWCNGAVWSMNSMPGVQGDVTDFRNKWNAALRERLYGPQRAGDLDGEYVDSSEGYVTDELDFRRDHFAATDTPLTFSPHTHQPAVFRGLIAFEYVRAIARDVHAVDKLMMANSTPIRLCWLAPMLDVMGTETNWNPGGRWRPMSDAELLYRRAMCKGKPFCFLMNTRFEDFSHELVERYMKRALAYGMFPGFFSHNASQGHYFTRPELYNRDRPLFQKYVPLCKFVAEAGWEPISRAHSSDEHVYVERFGERYLTVLNDAPDRRTATIRLDFDPPPSSRELVTGHSIAWDSRQATLTLDAEDVAVIDLGG